MTTLRGILVLAVALAAEVTLGYLVPDLRGYVDLMMLPVGWYAMARSQRAGMLVGCAAGFFQDAWFQAGVYGLRGFNKTLLGWALGGLAARFEVNTPAARWVAGMVLPVADRLMEVGLLRLLDQAPGAIGARELVVRAVVGGMLFWSVFGIVDRAHGRDLPGQALRRSA